MENDGPESGVFMVFDCYTLRSTPLDPYSEYFLENELGEGMSIGEKEVCMLLDKYFKENF